MKKLIFLLGLFAFFIRGYSQSNPTQTVTLSDAKTEAIVKNTLTILGAVNLPHRDTTFIALTFGQIIIRPADSLAYISTGLIGAGVKHWMLFGATAGSSPGAQWGVNITGNISAQADLQALVNTKQNVLPIGTALQYWDATGALQTFPSIPSQLVLTSPNNSISIGGVYPNLTIQNAITRLGQLTNDVGFISGNQTITISGDATGSGTTSIPIVFPDLLSGGTCTNCSLTVNNKGQITAKSSGTGSNLITSVFTRTGAVVAASGDYTAAQVTNAVSTIGSYTNPSWLVSIPFTKITAPPTTIAGYGITDNLVNTFNTRSGAVILTSGDVTGALTFTPVTNARTLTINGTTFDLTSNRSWTITGTGYTAADTGYNHIVASVFLVQKVNDSMKVINDARFLQKSNNLSDVASIATARNNLGLGTAALQGTAFFLQLTDTTIGTVSSKYYRQKGDDSVLALVAQRYLPLIWNANQTITGNSDTLKINTGLTQWNGGFGNITIGNGIMGIKSNLINNTMQIASVSSVDAAPALAMQYDNGTSTTEPLRIRHDSVSIYNNAIIFRSDGNSLFTSHVKGIIELASDSSANLASTATVKRMLVGFTPSGGDSALSVGLWISKTITGKERRLFADSASMAAYFLRRSEADITYITPTGLTTRLINTVNRISPVDSLTRVTKGLQIINNTLVTQTADASNVGFESTAHWLETDSLIRRLLKSKITLYHPGAGKWVGYSSVVGDSLYLKNLQVSTDLTLTAQTDSSLLFAINFGTIAGLTNTQTLTNKTLTSPVLNSPIISNPIINVGSDANGDMYYRNSSGNFARIVAGVNGQALRWAGGIPIWKDTTAGGGGSGGPLTQILSAFADTIKQSGTTQYVFGAADHSTFGGVTAALMQRLDSFVVVVNTGKGKPIARAPWTMDSLIFRGIGITGTSGITATYTGNNDSIAFNLAFTTLTTNGDQLIYNNGLQRVGPGSNGQIWTMQSNGLPAWQTTSGTGTVTIFSSTPTVGTLLTTSIVNSSTTPAQTIALANAPAGQYFGNNTTSTGQPAYHALILTSSDFANQGATNFVLHGNSSGNQTYGPVNVSTEVTGTLNAAQFPALTGDVTTVAGALATTIGALRVTNGMLAGNIDLTTKVTGIGSPANGFTGVNNGSKTITLGGNLTTSGVFNSIFTMTGATSVTFPTGGLLLTTTGSGSSLTGIPTSLTGTANQVIVSASTGAITLSLAQSLAPANSPTFTGETLTGLGFGSTADDLVTISGGVLRHTPLSFLLPTFLNNNTYSPIFTPIANTAGNNISSLGRTWWTRINNTVTVWGTINMGYNAANTFTQIKMTLPLASTFSTAWDVHGTFTADGTKEEAGFITASTSDGTAILAFFPASAPSGANLHYSLSYTIQ